MVELNFVTLMRSESESLEGVLETEAASLTDDFVVECALAVRDGLLVVAALLADGFNGLDVGFLPDECSAKEQCIVGMWYHERSLVDWRTCRRLDSNSGPNPVSSPIPAWPSYCALLHLFLLSAHRLPCPSSSPFSSRWPTSHYPLFSYDQSLPLRQLDDIIPAWLYILEHSLP